MLNNLTNRLTRITKVLRGQGRLTESNTQEMLREVRMALLEADVSLPVVREFIANVKEKAMGETVLTSLTPGQALVGIVHEELTRLMGGDLGEFAEEISLACQPPAIILMAGLQGAGKTTTVGKLAHLMATGQLKQQGQFAPKKKVLVVSTDVYRPAAIDQLRLVAEQAQVDFFPSNPQQQPQEIALAALEYAKTRYYDILIVDTAGRLGIDEAMMKEIQLLHQTLKPIETLFVVDSMLGQDAVNVAKAFADALPLTGVVLTKLDGDMRGGAALSVRHVTGKPLKFIGVSEKISGIEAFHPDRMARRILGMGDILSVIEQAHKMQDEEVMKVGKKIYKDQQYDLNDFRTLLLQMKGSDHIQNIMDKMPTSMIKTDQLDFDKIQKEVRRQIAIIDSMTPLERRKPDILKGARKRRIAAGAGVPVYEVNQLLKKVEQTKQMMKMMKKGGMLGKAMKGLAGMSSMKNMMGNLIGKR